MRPAGGRWIAAGALAAAALAPAPARAQEPVPVPNLSVVPVLELNFRGERGEFGGEPFDFGNGPAFGLRLHAWLSPVFGVAAHGSFARASHCQPGFCTPREATLWRGVGELAVKVRPGVPGYFIVGGGVTYVAPDADATGIFQGPDHLEPTLTAGAGVDFRVSGRGAFRLEARLYLLIPEEQEGLQMNSTQRDFAIGLGYAHRL